MTGEFIDKAADQTSDVQGIVISLTDLCNINCRYCFEGKRPEVIDHHPNFGQLLHTIKKLAHHSKQKPFYVSFYGGEPLLSFKSIQKIVEFMESNVQSNSIQYRVATNGVLLKGKIKEYLLEKQFSIQVSIDGDPETIDINRVDHNGVGSSKKIKHFLDNVRDYPRVMARVTVTPNTASNFYKSMAYLIGIGFDSNQRPIKFDFDYTQYWNESNFSALNLCNKTLSKYILDHYASGGCAYIEPLDRIFRSDRPSARSGAKPYCGAGCSQIHVSPKMEFYTCNRLTPSHNDAHSELKLSDGTLSFDKLSLITEMINKKIAWKEMCNSCQARHFCEQKCPARIYSGSGSFDIISDTQCRLIRETHLLGRRVHAGILVGNNSCRENFNKIYRIAPPGGGHYV